MSTSFLTLLLWTSTTIFPASYAKELRLDEEDPHHLSSHFASTHHLPTTPNEHLEYSFNTQNNSTIMWQSHQGQLSTRRKSDNKKDEKKNRGKNNDYTNRGKNKKTPNNNNNKIKSNVGGNRKPISGNNNKPNKTRPNKNKPNKNKPNKNKTNKTRPNKNKHNKTKPGRTKSNKKKPGKNAPSKKNPNQSKQSKNAANNFSKTDQNKPALKPTPKPPAIAKIPASNPAISKLTLSALASKSYSIDNTLFLYENPKSGKYEPSTIYKYSGLEKGLKVMSEKGVNGHYFYLGSGNNERLASKYGLINIAAFLAQSMKETIKYNACDENNWDLVDSKYYAISNACGQLGQSYQDYHCSEEEKHMECPVDKNMKITAVTHATWYGAPGPLYCGPKKNDKDFTGFWDYMYECNNPWATPPQTCDVYPDQKAGRYDNTVKVPNNAGRTDVEGCCWWGRGVIQTTGVCNFGKLNYYLGKKAADEGRDAVYAKVDFCKDPEVICSSQEFQELKWIAGMFYWMESVQRYDVRGWNYIEQLQKFVDGGFSDPSFINGVSGIVNRGCHDPPCGTGEVDGMLERAGNFEKTLKVFGLLG